jgi:hypothetical protein
LRGCPALTSVEQCLASWDKTATRHFCGLRVVDISKNGDRRWSIMGVRTL